MQRRTLLLAFVATGLVACAVDHPHASQEWAIIGGERTSMNEPAVVIIFNRFGGLCSGTIISPRVILTAKHCVQDSDTPDVARAEDLDVGVGDTAASLTRWLRVTDIWTTPGVYRDDGRLSGLVGVDVALITVVSDTGIEPVLVHRGDPAAFVGQRVKVVGFGQTPSGQSGVKYRVQSVVTGVDGSVLYTGPTTCPGDSGGPMINEAGEVIGVTSFGRGGCGGGRNGYNRVDLFLEEIDAVLEESGVCVSSGVELCNRIDDDCNGEVDEGCFEVGEACTSSDECSSQRCEMTPSGMLCTDSCDPLRPGSGCGVGLYCARTEGCEGWCIPGEAGTGENDATCAVDTDCLSLLCAETGGERRCVTPCGGGEGTCFSGEACSAGADACGGCVPAAISEGPGALGEPCEADADCASELCVTDAPEPYCSIRCTYDGGCADSFHCLTNENVCVRGPRSDMGGACTSDGNCSGVLDCETIGDLQICSRECDDAEDCNEGMDCLPVEGRSICVPTINPVGVPCLSADACASGVCEFVADGAPPVCTRSCDAETPCEAGFVCERQAGTVTGFCVNPAARPAPAEEGGCAVGGAGTSSGSHLWWLGMVAVLIRRRFRR